MKAHSFQYPKVSIILPVFNRRHLVERAIKSVFNQSVKEWELLIIDDGSEDELFKIVQPLIAQNSRIRYLLHQHNGLAFSRNVGIHAALGEFITFIDSDDEYLSNHLQTRIEFLEEHPCVSIIHGGVELVGPIESHYVQDAFNPNQKIHIKDCIVGATLFGRKRIFIETGGFKNLPYSAESEFIERVSQYFQILKVDFPTYRYYTGLNDSICAKVKKGEIESTGGYN